MSYEGYYEAARRFGLVIRPEKPGLLTAEIRVAGEIEGRAVSVRRTIGQHARAHFEASLRPALDMGLEIKRGGVTSFLGELFGAVDVKVGDVAFDDAYAVRADEPERAIALLGEPLRAAFQEVHALEVEVRDEVVAIDADVNAFGLEENIEWVLPRIEAVLRVAAAVDAARSAVPPAKAVAAFAPGLAQLAAERGLVCALDAPARVSGDIGDVWVCVATRRKAKDQAEISILVQPHQPFPFPLLVKTKATGITSWFAADDVKLGQPELDDAYDIFTKDVERLKAMVDPSLADEIVQLGEGRRLILDERGLALSDHAVDFDPYTLPPLIERAASLLSSLARMDRLGGGQGYR